MSAKLEQILDAANQLWPISGAESWDAPGLVTGSRNQSVSRILLSVDVTDAIVDEAIDGGFDLIIAHHPFIMRGTSDVSDWSSKGTTLSKAIRHGIAIFAAHTNADIVEDGVSAQLAKAFGLVDVSPLVPVPGNASVGHGRIGSLASPVSLFEFAQRVSAALPATATGVRVAGDRDRLIRTVALCGGAGDSFIKDAIAANADVYVTSDLRHHPVQDALEWGVTQGSGPALIDVSHWAAESLWLGKAADQITGIFDGVQVIVSQLRTDPWDFVV